MIPAPLAYSSLFIPGGIRPASRALLVSQAAVTKSLRLLEEETSTPLLIRRSRGVDLTPLRARQVEDEDFERFDYILAMDQDNRAQLRERCPAHLQGRIRLFMEFAERPDLSEVPDPYYGGPAGFEQVLDLVEEASHGLLSHLLSRARSR